jgi:hypothetical protein
MERESGALIRITLYDQAPALHTRGRTADAGGEETGNGTNGDEERAVHTTWDGERGDLGPTLEWRVKTVRSLGLEEVGAVDVCVASISIK